MANSMKQKDWMIQQFFRMWPRALFHSRKGKTYLQKHLNGSGVYVLYRDDQPYYIGKTINKTLIQRLSQHALKPNARYYNFWNYFSAFQIAETIHRDEIEAILISAMPTANSSHPRFPRRKLDRQAAKMLNDIQAKMLTGTSDQSGEPNPEVTEDEEEA
jgi:hypothetical protein